MLVIYFHMRHKVAILKAHKHMKASRFLFHCFHRQPELDIIALLAADNSQTFAINKMSLSKIRKPIYCNS